MKQPIQIIFFCLCYLASAAQALRVPVASPWLGPSVYSRHFATALSFTQNTGALALFKEHALEIYGERRYFLSQAQLFEAACVLPSSSGNFGLALNYFGYQNFHESQIGLGYGRRLAKTLLLGIKFNYYRLNIPGYVRDGAINFEVGLIYALNDKLSAGFHAYNPIGGKLNKQGTEKISSIYSCGWGYEFSKKVFLGFNILKIEKEAAEFHLALMYRFNAQFTARTGIEAGKAVVWGGIGFRLSQFRLDLTVSHHPQLGFSQGIGLVFQLRKEDESKSTTEE